MGGIHEGLRVTKGIGLAVFTPDGRMWTQRDVGSRSRTGRVAGRPSIPFETRKEGEERDDNVRGVLPEILNDKTLPQVAGHLHTVDGLRSTPDLLFFDKCRYIDYHIAVVVYDGPDMHFQPHDTAEAEPLGWMLPEEFLHGETPRPLATHAVGYLHRNGVIDRTLDNFRHESPRELLVPPWLIDVAKFHKEREGIPDSEPRTLYEARIA